jgi:hypothetical protein
MCIPGMTVDIVVAAQLDMKVEETGGEGESIDGAVGGTKYAGRKRTGKPHCPWSSTIAEVRTPSRAHHIYMQYDNHGINNNALQKISNIMPRDDMTGQYITFLQSNREQNHPIMWHKLETLIIARVLLKHTSCWDAIPTMRGHIKK